MKQHYSILHNLATNFLKKTKALALCSLLFFISICGNATQNGTNRPFEQPAKTLGIGLVKLSPTKVLYAYKDYTLTQGTETYTFAQEDGMVSPKFFDKNFNLCYFVCLDKTKDYYKILINPLEERYIKVADGFDFLEWDDFLRNEKFSFISRKDPTQNQLHRAPNEKSRELHNEDKSFFDMMTPLNIEGDWVKVRYFDKKKNRKAGWIKWRNDNKLLIHIHCAD